MNKYYFTFSKHSEHNGKVQEVLSEDYKSAISKVVKLYGNAWSTVYTEKQFQELDKSRLTLLPITL